MGSCHRRIYFSMQKEVLANECFIVSHFGLPLIFQPCIPVLIRPFLVSIPSWHINHSLSMGTLRSADLHLIVELHSVSSFHPYSMAITYLTLRGLGLVRHVGDDAVEVNARVLPAQSQKGGDSLRDFESPPRILDYLQESLKVP